MKKIGFDLDDVLLDMSDLILTHLNTQLNKNISKEDLTTFHYIEEVFGLNEDETNKYMEYLYSDAGHKNVRPVTGAVESISRIGKNNEIYIVTAKPDTLEKNTKEWLNSHFLPVFKDVHFTNQYMSKKIQKRKSDICEAMGIQIFVDDSLSNAKDISSVNIPVLLFDTPWNQTDVLPDLVKRVYSWDEIEKEIENLL